MKYKKGLDTMEEIYQETVKLFNAADCMVPCRDKILIYRKALAGFKKIEGYKDSKKYCMECRKRAKQTRADIKNAAYEAALNHLNNAKSIRDFIVAEEEFRALDDYQDSKNMADKCVQLKAKYEKKSMRGTIMQITIAVCVAFLLIASITTPFKYLRARAYKTAGMYNMAIKLYSKLDTYKDSEARLEECKYYYGLKLKEEKEYPEARQAFAAAHSYSDSDMQEVAMEKLIIDTHEAGNSVVIGGVSWIILEKRDNAALLIKSSHFSDITYHNELEDVTWESSSIRQWLNTEFITKTFSDEEKSNILLTDVVMEDNEMYNVDGGNDTQDYVFLLSSREAEQYADILGAKNVTSWLRSPGSNTQTASFLSDENIVMEYGYLVNSSGFTARPAMWFQYK